MTNQVNMKSIWAECPNCGNAYFCGEVPDKPENKHLWEGIQQLYEPCYDCQDVLDDYARMDSEIVDEFESCSEGCQYLYGYCIC